MSSLDDYQSCPRRWRTEERGRGHEHGCAVMFRRGAHHECRCCCGAIDLAQWDLPASKTPSLTRRATRRPKRGEPTEGDPA